MQKQFSRLLLSAVAILLGLAALHAGVTYSQQTRILEHHHQLIQMVLTDELATPVLTVEKLREIQDKLDLTYLSVFDQTKQQVILETSPQAPMHWLIGLYPLLKGSLLLPVAKQEIRFQLNPDPLQTTLTEQSLLVLSSLLLALGVMVWLHQRQINWLEHELEKEVRDPESTSGSGPLKRVSDALFAFRHQVALELEEAARRCMELELRANQDPMTGLLNRNAFRQDLTQILQDDSGTSIGMLAMVRATELAFINQQRGFVAGDKYLLDVSQLITKASKRLANARIYRLAGSDFAVLLRSGNLTHAQTLGRDLQLQFDNYQAEQQLESVAYCGLTLVRSGQQPDQVMGRSDLTLAKAQTSIVNGWYIQENDGEDYFKGESHWKQVISDVIERKAIMLMQQPIQSMNISIRTYNEVCARFVGPNEQVMPTETLLAMAQRHDLLIRLEQQIIELIVQQYPIHAHTNQRWGINLSANALMNNAFLIWLERLLLRDNNIAGNLVFELDEDLLDCNLAASTRLFDMFRRVGSRSCISKFGKGLGSFRLYRELKPDYIKLDTSLINVLERDSTSQQFIRMIVEVSHRLGCVVIAEGVENVAQKQMLETMYIDAIQGYLVARPTPILQLTDLPRQHSEAS